MLARARASDPRLNAVASLKPYDRRTAVLRHDGDPRLNAVASLKQAAMTATSGYRCSGDPRLNAVASLKLVSVDRVAQLAGR